MKNNYDETTNDHNITDSSNNNISVETDLKVFKGGISLNTRKGNVKNHQIFISRSISKSKNQDITNINININNSKITNNSKTLSKIIIPDLNELNMHLGEKINQAINTFSSRQPADKSFRDAIKLMYKKIENDNETKYKDKDKINKTISKSSHLVKKKESLGLKIEVNKLPFNNFEDQKKLSKTKEIKGIKLKHKESLISESPLNNIQMPIDYKSNEKIKAAKAKIDKKVIPSNILNNIKRNISSKQKSNPSQIEIINEKEIKTVLANINCVLSTKTVEDVLFVTDSEYIIKFPNSLISNSLLDYIGDDFSIEISHKETKKNVLEEIHKKYAKAFNSRFSNEINQTSNFYLIESINRLIKSKYSPIK